jgi:hypothetical protein
MRSEPNTSTTPPSIRRFMLAAVEHQLPSDRDTQDAAAASGRRDLEVIDRLGRLRVVLPALAQDATEARRETARLRRENSQLVHRLTELEAKLARGWLGNKEAAV